MVQAAASFHPSWKQRSLSVLASLEHITLAIPVSSFASEICERQQPRELLTGQKGPCGRDIRRGQVHIERLSSVICTARLPAKTCENCQPQDSAPPLQSATDARTPHHVRNPPTEIERQRPTLSRTPAMTMTVSCNTRTRTLVPPSRHWRATCQFRRRLESKLRRAWGGGGRGGIADVRHSPVPGRESPSTFHIGRQSPPSGPPSFRGFVKRPPHWRAARMRIYADARHRACVSSAIDRSGVCPRRPRGPSFCLPELALVPERLILNVPAFSHPDWLAHTTPPSERDDRRGKIMGGNALFRFRPGICARAQAMPRHWTAAPV